MEFVHAGRMNGHSGTTGNMLDQQLNPGGQPSTAVHAEPVPSMTPYTLALAGIREQVKDGNLDDLAVVRLLRDRLHELPKLKQLWAPPLSPADREKAVLTRYQSKHGNTSAGLLNYLQKPGGADDNDPLADPEPVRDQPGDEVETHTAHFAREAVSMGPKLLAALEAQSAATVEQARTAGLTARLRALEGLQEARQAGDTRMIEEYERVLAGLEAAPRTDVAPPGFRLVDSADSTAG